MNIPGRKYILTCLVQGKKNDSPIELGSDLGLEGISTRRRAPGRWRELLQQGLRALIMCSHAHFLSNFACYHALAFIVIWCYAIFFIA